MTTLIALGANLDSRFGSPQKTMMAALSALAARGVEAAATSRWYRSPAFPSGSGPDFVNAAARVVTDLDPAGVLVALKSVEADMGRTDAPRWAPRVLDLDLIAMGDIVLPDAATQGTWRQLSAEAQRTSVPDQLILPHPRLQDRAFVLVPLCDIAPNWRHPVLARTAAQLCADLPAAARAEITPI